MKNLASIFSLMISLIVCGYDMASAQSAVKGPLAGSVTSGVAGSTLSFSQGSSAVGEGGGLKSFEINVEVEKLPNPKNIVPPLGPPGSNYHEDILTPFSKVAAGTPRPVSLLSFEGVPQTNYIPPDPIIAVGPNNVIVAVNATWRIFDKAGTILKTIDSPKWFSSILPSAAPSDPIVMYDHFAHRWIFTSINVDTKAKKSYILISTSASDDPLGTWYTWALPSDEIGDSAVTNWSDYDRVGFDSSAIYITGNQFDYQTDKFVYSKVRIIDKSKLYANTAGPVTWFDFWDFRDPSNTGNAIFGLRPTIMFDNPGVAFFVNESPYQTGTFFSLWTLTNPLSNPACTGTDVPVVQYSSPPNPSQLGGGALLIEAGGSDIHNEPLYRDSSIWAVQSIASGTNNAYSAVRYVRINPFQAKTVEDVALGLEGYWHIYPSIMVDPNKNLIITFCRSNAFEYMGAFATGRRSTDPFQLAPSVTIRAGLGNYVKDFNTQRNRWGDYSGIALDPVDANAIWTHTEFVSAVSTWDTWVAKMKMSPLPGPYMSLDRSSFNFDKVAIGLTSDTVSFTVINDGIDTLKISGITGPGQNFQVTNLSTFPLKIQSLSSFTVRLVFTPKTSGIFSDSLLLNSNDPNRPSVAVLLSGLGYTVTNMKSGTMYATSDASDGGRLFTVNTSTGQASLVGPTTAVQITGLGVHPSTKELIGIDPSAFPTGMLYKLSTTGYYVQSIDSLRGTSLHGMAFQDDSTFYVGSVFGNLFRVKYPSFDTTLISRTGMRISGVAFNPISGEVWLAGRSSSGVADAIYRLDGTTGAMIFVGKVGLGAVTNAILFDKSGKLYGVTIAGANPCNLVRIDTATGAGTVIGSMGNSHIQGIALSPDAVAGVGNERSAPLPTQYSLEQNFPNPFNPSTIIQFSIPKATRVTLTVYDVLGRVLMTLVDGVRQPGVYQTRVDGSRMASGLYYYRLKAGEFNEVMRMVLLK